MKRNYYIVTASYNYVGNRHVTFPFEWEFEKFDIQDFFSELTDKAVTYLGGIIPTHAPIDRQKVGLSVNLVYSE